MPDNYRECYRALGLPPVCSIEEVRLAYRRRVRACHPDRAGTPPAADPDEFGRVVIAYRRLVRFYREHGRLPHQPIESAARLQRLASRRADFRSRWRCAFTVPRLHRFVFLAFVGGVAATAALDQLQPPGMAEQARPNGRIAVGMAPAEVVRIQGVPQFTKGSVWFYGESGIIFERGCVIGWEDRPPFPLRTLIGVAYASTAQRFCRDPAD